MPELLDPRNVTFVGVPSPAQPVPQGQAPAAGPAPAQPAEPADAFQVEPGPHYLILPHEGDDDGPERQGRAGRPVRLSADVDGIHRFLTAGWDKAHAEVTGGEIRGSPFDRQGWAALADALHDRGKTHTGSLIERLQEPYPRVMAEYSSHRSRGPGGGILVHSPWHLDTRGIDRSSLSMDAQRHEYNRMWQAAELARGHTTYGTNEGEVHAVVAGLPLRIERVLPFDMRGQPSLQPFYNAWILSHKGQVPRRPAAREALPTWERPIARLHGLTHEDVAGILMEHDGGPLRTAEWEEVDSLLPPTEEFGGSARLNLSQGSQPERFAAAQAPAGDLVSRGINYQGGQFIPDWTPAPLPAAPVKPSARERLRGLIRKGRKVRAAREGQPVRNAAEDGEALYRAMHDNKSDMARRLIYADWLDESGRSGDAARHRRLATLYPHGELGYRRSPLDPDVIRRANADTRSWPPAWRDLAKHLIDKGLPHTGSAMLSGPQIPSPFDRTGDMGAWESYRWRTTPPYNRQAGLYLFSSGVETPGDETTSLYHEVIANPDGTGTLRVKTGGLETDAGARYFAIQDPEQVKDLLEESLAHGRKRPHADGAWILDEHMRHHPSPN